MISNIEIAKKISEAWNSKDSDVMRSFLHEDYHFKGPMMEINGVEECIEGMKDCPFKGRNDNSEMIAQGDKVVHILDWVVSAPFQETIPMVEVMEFDKGKVIKSRLFFDTALFPAEFIEQMKEQAA